MTRSIEDFEKVLGLIADGYNDCQISRLSGIPRETVRCWRSGEYNDTERNPALHDGSCRKQHDYSQLCANRYSYLLGMYLGDGCISRARYSWNLRIVMDALYPSIIDECCVTIEALMPGKHAHRYPRRGSRCDEVSMHSKHWPCLFPQHGPGKKHERTIQLDRWQRKLVEEAPESFVRGLIHSDGCRVVANDRGVASVRYHFSNRSEDIKALFCASLDQLQITWTRPCDRQIAIYRKAAVAQLDRFIGSKR
jgi:hypothetical protein